MKNSNKVIFPGLSTRIFEMKQLDARQSLVVPVLVRPEKQTKFRNLVTVQMQTDFAVD